MRVLLVLMALAAVLAWQWSIVIKRRTAMSSGPEFVMAGRVPGQPHVEVPRVNLLRELLGDHAIRYIFVLPQGDWEREIAKLRILFPEAKVFPGYPPFDEP